MKTPQQVLGSALIIGSVSHCTFSMTELVSSELVSADHTGPRTNRDLMVYWNAQEGSGQCNAATWSQKLETQLFHFCSVDTHLYHAYSWFSLNFDCSRIRPVSDAIKPRLSIV